MGALIDLLTATQDAVIAGLQACVPAELATVHQHVLENAQPPLVIVGDIDSENEAGKGEQLEKLRVQVQSLYQGKDRRQLFAIMHAVRRLELQTLVIEGVAFSIRFDGAATTTGAGPNGVLYAGITSFEIYAEPA